MINEETLERRRKTLRLARELDVGGLIRVTLAKLDQSPATWDEAIERPDFDGFRLDILPTETTFAITEKPRLVSAEAWKMFGDLRTFLFQPQERAAFLEAQRCSDAMCQCGRPLHYNSPGIKRSIDSLIAELGEFTTVEIAGARYQVSRHFLALHGFSAAIAEQFHFTPEGRES